MKLICVVVLALFLSGCVSGQSVSFSPSQNYSVDVRSSIFDAVRTDVNDTTLFKEGKSVGFIRIEPVPADVTSASLFLDNLKTASTSDTVETIQLDIPTGFEGFAVENRGYLTGYLVAGEKSDSILILSFPADEFKRIAETISPGI